jgi:hypothetical protein
MGLFVGENTTGVRFIPFLAGFARERRFSGSVCDFFGLPGINAGQVGFSHT